MDVHLTSPLGWILSVLFFIFGAALFIWETGEVIASLFAALLAAALFWVSYVLVRWLVLALTTKSDE